MGRAGATLQGIKYLTIRLQGGQDDRLPHKTIIKWFRQVVSGLQWCLFLYSRRSYHLSHTSNIEFLHTDSIKKRSP